MPPLGNDGGILAAAIPGWQSFEFSVFEYSNQCETGVLDQDADAEFDIQPPGIERPEGQAQKKSRMLDNVRSTGLLHRCCRILKIIQSSSASGEIRSSANFLKERGSSILTP